MTPAAESDGYPSKARNSAASSASISTKIAWASARSNSSMISVASSGAISSRMLAAFSGSRFSTIRVVSLASNSAKTAAAVSSSREAMMLWRSDAESSSMMSAKSAGCRSSSFSCVMRNFTRRNGSGSIKFTNSQRIPLWGSLLCSLRTTFEGTTPCRRRRTAPGSPTSTCVNRSSTLPFMRCSARSRSFTRTTFRPRVSMICWSSRSFCTASNDSLGW